MEEALIKRILPHSIEAEQSVIGSMILDRDAILVASEILTSDDFYQNQYGIIFDAMVELCNEGKPVDLVTLPEPFEGERPSAGYQQHGIRKRIACGSSYFCECEILCQYCQRKSPSAPPDQGKRRGGKFLLSGKREHRGDS